MSPEVIGLDEVPTDDDLSLGSDVPSGTVPCPECGSYFKSKGLTRHRVNAHGVEPPARSGGTPADKGKATQKFAMQWAEFQRGAALFVSFACTDCAAVLVEDAQRDGEAIAVFCETRPKLKKQIQQALTGMDIMILVGALGETGRKMISHHEIGKKLGMPGPQHTHSGGDSAQEKMMNFLVKMPEEDRNMLLNQVFSGMAANGSSNAPAAAPVAVTVVLDDEETPGQPPVVMPDNLTEQDRYHMAMAHSGSSDFESVL
jgi:hypothetical protein